MTFAAEVERVWPGRAARFEMLGGGITNHNLKVEVDGEYFVLRVAGKDTNLLGIDRTVELAATRRPRRSGSGPRWSRSSSRRAGSSRASSTARSRRSSGCASRTMLTRVAAALRAFHDGPARSPGCSTPSASSRPTADTALERGGRVPDGVRVGARDRRRGSKRDALAPTRCPVPQRPSERELPRRRRAALHRRLGVRGDGRPVLRPRELLDQPRARRDAARVLLRERTSATSATRTRRPLELMRFMSDFREAMWGVVQSAVSELDFDFDAYAASTSSGSSGRRRRPRSSRRSRLNARGAPCGAPRSQLCGESYLASVGTANFPACSSSSRSSSSSVPIRTGPLNHLLAERTHHPPKSSNAPPTRIGA